MVTGRPAVLGGAALADLAAREVAALQGAADGIAAPSTLHLAVDLFTAGFGSDATLLWDAHLYPVLRMGFGLARRPAERIAPHDPAALRDRIATVDRRPVLVTDGYCIACGRPAPLATYLTLLRPREASWWSTTLRGSACSVPRGRGRLARVGAARRRPRTWQAARRCCW